MGLPRRVSLPIGVVCAAAALGCGSTNFTTSDGGHNESGESDASGADASGSADGGPGPEASPVNPAFTCDTSPQHRLCDTFDDMDTLANWWGTIPGCGAATVGSAEWVTPTHSLIGELVDGGTLVCAATQTTFMPSTGVAHCEFDVRYDEPSVGESASNYFTMVVESPVAGYYDFDLGLQLGTSPPLYVAETFNDADGGQSYVMSPVAGPMLPSDWHHVSLQLDPPNQQVLVTFDDQPQQTVPLPHLPPGITALTAQFGVTYNAVMAATKVRFDDVWCDVQ